MKAIVCEKYGPIDGLRYADVADPVPGPREIVVGAEAIGVNFPDGLLVQGLYQAKPPTPFTPGMEVVGKVLSVGSEVKRFLPGDRVGAVSMMGAYAEQVKVHQNAAMPIPPEADARQVTALMCGYGTAHHALKQRAQLKAGETLAVTGAAGLTGLAAVQIGKAMGARVIAIASSAEKRKLALDNGADTAIGYDNLRDGLKEATGGQGVDVAFDVVGGDAFDALSRSMAWGGRLLVIGFAGGRIPEFPVNLALVKGYSVVGVFWGTFTQREPEANAANMAELMQWFAAGKIRPHVEKTFPLAKAAEALHFIHARHAAGKVVLKP
jgi:NADPH2:quinone reductase